MWLCVAGVWLIVVGVWQHYEWKQLGLSGIGKYCLEGLLGNEQEDSLFQAFDALRVGLADKVVTLVPRDTCNVCIV